MKTSTISTCLGLALSLTTGCVGSAYDGGSDDNILGGSVDYGDPAVGAIRYMDATGSEYICSGTLVSPRLLVSAGHCAVPAAYDVSFDTSPNLAAPIGTQGWITASAIASPLYDGNGADGHDVSVILLSKAVTTTLPVPLGGTPAQGSTLRAVGYGMNVNGDDGTGAGVKRQVNVAVDAVATHEIVTGQQGQGTCHGDSGGPFFDAGGNLVATTSYGDDATCDGDGHEMRIDDNLDFINQYIAFTSGAGGGGSTTTQQCDSDVNGNEVKCTGGSCTCLVNGQEVGTCTASDPSTACSIPGDCCGF